VVLSRSGNTAMAVAAARPAAPMIVASPDAATCRRANLLWGAVPVLVEADALDDPNGLARQLAASLGFAGADQHILTVANFQPGDAETAPTIAILRL